MPVLHGNDAFSNLVLSNEKQYPSFLKKVFVLQKSCFKVNPLKKFKIFTDCHIKTCRSFKLRAILKIPSTVFEKNLCSFCWLQNETSKKEFSSVKTKTNPNFAVKLAGRSRHSFLLSF